jgi:hypothetical protein
MGRAAGREFSGVVFMRARTLWDKLVRDAGR